MNTLPILLCAAAIGLMATTAGAQDDTPAPATESAPAATPSDEPRAAEAEAEDDDVFVPSEELQAEEEVTFPVDI